VPEQEHQSQSSRLRAMEARRLVVTVHGIRTFGDWQERIEGMLLDHPNGSDVEVINYKFGYFSIVAFTVPFLRWLVVRRFSKIFHRLMLSNTMEED
jgi:hypothetical protein